MPTQMQTLYTGRSGHLAVVSKFLHRGYNAAIPEVDRGDDIFVVKDEDGDLSRIQVKAGIGKGKRKRSALYKTPLAQLQRMHTPELHYIFAIHYENDWRDFLIISRQLLWDLKVTKGIGTPVEGGIVFRFSFTVGTNDVLCSGENLAAYRNNWDQWPVILH